MVQRETVPERLRVIVRAALIPLGAIQAVNGVHALLWPRSFYEDFPFGRGWVEKLPDYSEHLVRDIGGLFLGTGILLLAAAWYLDRRLLAIALVSFLAFSLPHTIYHALNLEPYETSDAILNALALGATVIVPLVVLALLLGTTAERTERR